jgi:ribosomal protein S18 acetylase RimI-like enzyme
MKEVRSLALRTDLMIRRLSGSVEDRGGCLAVRTPSVPDFWYGNCLAMPSPPAPGDFGRWMARFDAEFPEYAEGGHRVFLVDSPEGEAGDSAPFLEAGFELNVNDVLATARPRRPERLTERYPIRALASDSDWAELVEASLEVNAGTVGYDCGYLERRTRTIRAAVERGEGAWWAAWDGERIAGHLGLFWEGGLARFQDVETRPAYRRQGVCRSVLNSACEDALAPEDESVRRIYESLGFEWRERTVDYSRPPERMRPAADPPGTDSARDPIGARMQA